MDSDNHLTTSGREATSLRHVIVPVDQSPEASIAMAHAAHLAAQLDAELILLGLSPWAIAPTSIAPILIGSPQEPAVAQDRLDRLTQKHLDDAAADLPPGVRWRTAIGWGAAGPAIVDAAKEYAADLIVLPMRRGGGFSHLLHDGEDRYVLHSSPVPVVVVPAA
jgi:nucleotide-binding universal stress UspA family protein